MISRMVFGDWIVRKARSTILHTSYCKHQTNQLKLVVPSSLQMGWVESPPYFCAASETVQDVATQYIKHPIGTLEEHKFIMHAMKRNDLNMLPDKMTAGDLRYFVDVYVDDFISMAIASSREQLRRIANGVMHSVHDMFPAQEQDNEDPISMKKIKKGEGVWALQKDILGFTFGGKAGRKTLQLEAPKQEFLLLTLHKWLRTAQQMGAPVPFDEFESIVAKLRHAFISIPAGVGLLSCCNQILGKRPQLLSIWRNRTLFDALRDCRMILCKATICPTPCCEWITAWPQFVGVKDASKHGVDGVVIGNTSAAHQLFSVSNGPRVLSRH